MMRRGFDHSFLLPLSVCLRPRPRGFLVFIRRMESHPNVENTTLGWGSARPRNQREVKSKVKVKIKVKGSGQECPLYTDQAAWPRQSAISLRPSPRACSKSRTLWRVCSNSWMSAQTSACHESSWVAVSPQLAQRV
jgi:hypothetical protein